jgi:hypothetical protein
MIDAGRRWAVPYLCAVAAPQQFPKPLDERWPVLACKSLVSGPLAFCKRALAHDARRVARLPVDGPGHYRRLASAVDRDRKVEQHLVALRQLVLEPLEDEARPRRRGQQPLLDRSK